MPPMPPVSALMQKAREDYLKVTKKATEHHRCVLHLCKNLDHYRWITLTFKPRYHVKLAADLFYQTVGLIYAKLWRIAGKSFSFVPELTERGQLHYHLLVRTNEHVRLAVFTNYWEHTWGHVDYRPVWCILFLKHHYMRKQNEEMGKLLHWPRMTLVMSGMLPNVFYKRLAKELIRRNKFKRLEKLEQFKLKFIDMDSLYAKREHQQRGGSTPAEW